MGRFLIAVMLLLLQVIQFPSASWAKDSGKKTASARKHIVKKYAPAKRKVTAAKSKRAVTAAKSKQKLRAYSTQRKKVSAAKRGRLVKKTIIVRGKRKTIYVHAAPPKYVRRAPPVRTVGDLAGLNRTNDPLDLNSNAALVLDPTSSEVLFEKNSGAVLPIASITKLMTALVVVESGQDMDEVLTVTSDDIDRLKHTSSRLRVGSRLTRANMLHIALMSSENRAASALGRHYPGGLDAFVAAMNTKARTLGMTDTRYVEPTGLSRSNVSSARDLAKLVLAAQQHPIIREYSTNKEYEVEPGGRSLQYHNSNRLVANPQWDIVLQKTGYISEAGRCLVMQTMIDDRAIVMVFLDAKGKFSRAADAGRMRKWLENTKLPSM
ncbi:D-alanyl-D-alanine endopeptidase [Noviherbaspirillum agri]